MQLNRKSITCCVLLVSLVAVAFGLLFTGTAAASYSWIDSRGPGNGDAQALAYDSARNILYRGTSGRGVWKYKSNAWHSLGGGVNGFAINALVYDSAADALFVGTTSNGVWRCTHPGSTATWTKVSGPSNIGGHTVYSLALDSSRGVLYAGVFDFILPKGVWRCSNPRAGSPGWTDTGGSITTFAVYSLAYDSTRNVLYAGAGGTGTGVWACPDPNGASPSWSDTTGGVSTFYIRSLAMDQGRNVLYAGASDLIFGQGVWRYDAFLPVPAWTKISDGGNIGFYTSLALSLDTSRDLLYAGTASQGAWRCAHPDTAPGWTYVSGSVTGLEVRSMAFASAGNALFVGSAGKGVLRCDHPNTTGAWSDTGGGVSIYEVNAMAYDGARGLLYAGVSGYGVWRCDGDGSSTSWKKVSSAADTGNLNVYSLAYDGSRNILYAGTINGVWRCTDPNGSHTWKKITGDGDIGNSVIRSLALDGSRNILYSGPTDLFGTGQGLWRSANPSATSPSWVSTGGAVGGYIVFAIACDSSHDTLYAACFDLATFTGKGVWRCSRPGSGAPAWHGIGGSLSAYDFRALSCRGDVLYAGATGHGVCRSKNPRAAAPTWKNMGGGLSSMDVRSLYSDSGRGVLYAGTWAHGVWRCDSPTASKPSWLDTGGELQSHNVFSLASAAGSGRLFAGTGAAGSMGAWYSSYPEIVSCKPSSAGRGDTVNVAVVAKNTGFVGWSSKGSFGDGVTVNSLSVVDSAHATASITVSPDAKAGARDVNVVTGSERPDPLKGGFVVSVPAASPTWYLAEGTTDYGFETYVTIENPNTVAVTAVVTYMTKSGPRRKPDLVLAPLSQTVFNPRSDLGATDFSTQVVCKEGRSIAVDRRMTWTGKGASSPEGHSSVGVTAPAKTWYLPEGSSKWGFECWLLVQNPNASAAKVTLTYMAEGVSPVKKTKTVAANSRASFSMKDDIGARDASIMVSADKPVIPERAMYRGDRREGHDSIGTTTPATDYYLAEGSSNWGFTTYVLVQNPGAEQARVTLTYMTPAGPKVQPAFDMPPSSRKTIRVNDAMPGQDFSTKVHADRPVIAERAMYWDNGTGEATHDSIGMNAAHSTFYLPDGESDFGYETWTLVQNPNASEVTVEITYLLPLGAGNKTVTDKIPANSRKTYFMADAVPNGHAAIMVTSKTAGKKIMVERAMYWNSRGAGTDTIGGFSD